MPAAIGARRPQAEQAATRRWQAGHQGRPVAREMPQRVWPQMEQVSSGSSWQRGARGPSWVRRSTAAAPAADAGLQVGRVGDEAVGAQRPALVIAGAGSRRAPQRGALLDARAGDTGPADPPAIQRLVDAHDPVTAGAGRADDPGDAGGMQRFDQPRDRPQRRQMALPGQQPGAVLQCPGQFLLV